MKARKRGEEMHEDFLETYYREHPEQLRKRQNYIARTGEGAT